MNVPNHDKVPFEDMTPKERSAIVEAWIDSRAEVWNWSSGAWKHSSDLLVSGCCYRTKPSQLIITWEHIKPEYKWAAMDSCENVYFYPEKPEMLDSTWTCYMWCQSPLSIDTTGIDWRESLVQRPEGV